jgi:hypothetical protein
MKKYFLHNGIESSGPFDINELKVKKITKNTPVWFEGMENWSTAGKIEELSNLFEVIPPPISTYTAPSTTPKTEKTKAPQKILGLSKNAFFIGIGVIIILIGISVLNTLEQNRSRELDIKNHKTDIENRQYELQQKELEEQKRIQEEAEKAAAERAFNAKKESQKSNLIAIQSKITDYQSQLKEVEKKLNDASGFKFFRTAAEKKEQMNVLQKEIDSFKNQIDQLKKDSNRMQLEIEKME